MTRNPALPIAPVTDPIKVALLTDDPLLRAGVSSLLEQLGSIDVVDRDRAEVALWDAGVDTGKTLARLTELRALDMPVVAVVGDPAHVALPSRQVHAGSCCAIRSGPASMPRSLPCAVDSP